MLTYKTMDTCILEDWVADSYVACPTKRSLFFHKSEACEVQLTYSTHGNNIPETFNTLFILESAKYFKFFEAVRLFKLPLTQDPLLFPKLTMTLINTVVKNIESETEIRQFIGQDYKLPEKFECAMFRFSEYMLTVIPANIIRCYTNVVSPNLLRLGVCFRIGNDLKFLQPRKYEHDLMGNESVWPYKLTAESSNVSNDMACIILEKCTFLDTQVQTWLEHMCKLTKGPKIDNFEDVGYRIAKQFQSKHIPRIHGKTGYGHYLPNTLHLLKVIEPLLKLQGFVSTCEIIARYSPKS